MSRQKTNTRGALALAGIIAAMVALGAISKSDAEVRQQALNRYCEGVAIWRAEALRGIEPTRRAGRPEGRHSADERCDDLPAQVQEMTRKRQQLAHY
ncbi:hypothetical protein [Halomonas piscis]|uniref:hypothetical protein n=1 Tax=Halomonas piscis TaxID=3031727 RepID=UPI0028A192E3|nr:hypothetical protein [Halomonas piscis]